MNKIIIFFVLLISVFCAQEARADINVFPPGNAQTGGCNGSEHALTWDGSGDVQCKSVEDLLKIVAPDCKAGEFIALNSEGNGFECKASGPVADVFAREYEIAATGSSRLAVAPSCGWGGDHGSYYLSTQTGMYHCSDESNNCANECVGICKLGYLPTGTSMGTQVCMLASGGSEAHPKSYYDCCVYKEVTEKEKVCNSSGTNCHYETETKKECVRTSRIERSDADATFKSCYDQCTSRNNTYIKCPGFDDPTTSKDEGDNKVFVHPGERFYTKCYADSRTPQTCKCPSDKPNIVKLMDLKISGYQGTETLIEVDGCQ